MSLTNLNIVTSGLVFSCDMNNSKSWTGKPTTNYAYAQNARADSSYTSYSATGSGTWNAKHPDAINAYNIDGSDITGYVNTGVTDWTNTYHAIWTYDYELGKPVVTMRDIDGQWKAKSFGLSVSTPAGMGLSIGSTYSISWLSWTDDITKCANAGMYMRRASDGAYNFWDGQSNSQSTAFNTKPRTWQRVYAVYTVNSGADVNGSWSCYMYGHYGNRGTVKIADVQIEAGPPSGFSRTLTRSNTQALIDQTKNSTITANSLTYNNDGTFSFNGSNNYITTPASSILNMPSTFTLEAWVKPFSVTDDRAIIILGQSSYYLTIDNGLRLSVYCYGKSPAGYHTDPTALAPATWSHICAVWTDGEVRLFVNGNFRTSASTTGTPNTVSTQIIMGSEGNGSTRKLNGYISSARIYNVSLSDNQVKQNFNALRARYGV